MKKILTVLTIVLCMMMGVLAVGALAESSADAAPVGVWTDARGTNLAEFKDDGTMLLYRVKTGCVLPYVWQQSGEFVEYGDDFEDGWKGAMEYDADADILTDMSGGTYTRMDDEEFAAFIDELSANVKLDAVLEDFIGSWEYSGVYLTEDDETFSAEEYPYFDLHFTITDTTFSLPDGLYYSGGVGCLPMEVPCTMEGNVLRIWENEWVAWTAAMSPEGVMSFWLPAFPLKCTLYLTRVEQD